MRLLLSYFIWTGIISFIISAFGSSCAIIVPPGGGPKDTLPPVLVNAVPVDSALHFNAYKIVLGFDEYVQLDNSIQTALIVSPNPVNSPIVTNKLKSVTIKIRDSLLPNTTYSINFANTLKDVNEGNVYKNFTYVFSTGDKIDDGRLSGKVILAETGGYDSTLLVVLHKNLNDSAIKKTRPDYYTTVDGKGNFKFRYLPPGKFAVYVVPDDYTKRYDDSTKMFAFLNAPVDVDSSAQADTLYAYEQFTEKENMKILEPRDHEKKKPAAKKLTFSLSLEDKRQDLLKNLNIVFQKKITKYDSSGLALADTNYKPIKGYSISEDTSSTKFTIKYNWKENQYFKLIIQKDAFVDSIGTMLSKNDTITFETKKEYEYGSLLLRFPNIDLTKNPVIQFYKDERAVDSIPLVTNTIYRKLFPPGNFYLRVLYDNNKNGTWDPGNFDLKKQPEIVQRIKQKLLIKNNWDNEVDINL